jgi:phage terminase large subunit-like protein
MLANKQWGYEFVIPYVEHFLQFTKVLKHTQGPDAGKPIVLEPFQIFAICAIYGFRSKKDHTKRMTTDVIIFIPRKAGKSTFTAMISLYELKYGEVTTFLKGKP